MASLMDLLGDSLDQRTVSQIGNQLGVDPQTAQGAISAAIPMIVAGLARNASTPSGAAALTARSSATTTAACWTTSAASWAAAGSRRAWAGSAERSWAMCSVARSPTTSRTWVVGCWAACSASASS